MRHTTSPRCRFSKGRHAGLLVPLFSAPSVRSWGLGEIGDLPALTAWLADAGLDVLQVLPINELPPGESSPYSALTAMAIDPIYISVEAADDFRALGDTTAIRRELAAVRAAPRIDYAGVRALKMPLLAAAFDRFQDEECARGRKRAERFREYIAREAWWLEEYAVFRAIHADQHERPWPDWDPALRNRDPAAIAEFRRDRTRAILFYQYLQWIAASQWAEARAAAGPVGLFGDLPFAVSADSADVWERRAEFQLEASVGTPPDAFSDTGQNWGLPPCRWDVMAQGGFTWLRQRARRMADLFDGYRIDHLVGFYRTYVRPSDGSAPHFSPPNEEAQRMLGERLIEIFREPGAFVIAEDLGTVPDFVRASLARLGVPGYRVLRWERDWHRPGQPYRDPAAYPPASLATTGTHDMEPLAVWWDGLSTDQRAFVASIPALADRAITYRAPFGPDIRDAILESLFASGSDLLLLPVQDLFGWRDRINNPAVIEGDNWTYRLPWPVDRLPAEPEAQERLGRVREWTRRYDRGV